MTMSINDLIFKDNKWKFLPVQRPHAHASGVFLACCRRGSIHQVFEEVKELLRLDALLPGRQHTHSILRRKQPKHGCLH